MLDSSRSRCLRTLDLLEVPFDDLRTLSTNENESNLTYPKFKINM